MIAELNWLKKAVYNDASNQAEFQKKNSNGKFEFI